MTTKPNKLAIIVGHNVRAPGAVRVTDWQSEYVWNGRLAEMIKSHNPSGIQIFRRTSEGGYSREIDRVYAETDRWGATCCVELHFNSDDNPNARGCLVLSSGTAGSIALAKEIYPRMAEIMATKKRGIEIRQRHDRGGRSLWQGKSPCIMTEPYFGSNVSDCMVADRFMDELAEAVYRGAIAFMKGI